LGKNINTIKKNTETQYLHFLPTKFCLEHFTGRGHFGDLGVDGSVILKWYFDKEIMKIEKPQDRIIWRVFANTIMNNDVS
jgi:hypothetical protein